MVVEAQRLPFESLARLAERLAAGVPLGEALELVAQAAVDVTGAELAVVRGVDDAEGARVARAVAPADSPHAAEVSGSRVDPGYEPPPERVLVPARAGERLLGAIELVGELDASTHLLAEVVASQLAFALGQLAGAPSEGRLPSLRRAGAALAAGGEPERAARLALREAAVATGARQGAIWQTVGEGLEPLAWDGVWEEASVERARTLALEARAAWQPLLVDRDPLDSYVSISIRLGEPASGVMQLRFREEPAQPELDALAEFAARVAHALRLGARARDVSLELERTRALLSVVGDAISHLSLAHTLETAVERIASLLAIDRVGIYLRDERHRLSTAAGRELDEGHESVANALLGLATGALRARETIVVRVGSRDPALAPAVRVLAAAGLSAALAVPLRVHDETIGLLVAYPGARRATAAERALLAALAGQLAVAVQNARLHEEAKELGEALGSVLEAERQAARRLGALYEIANTFTRSLSLERTLQSVTETIVHVLGLDNARLYQQQKAFAETIQRALLPGQRPELPGFDVGAVYESAARLDVGGDVYDFLELGDGRIAIVLGDVTGHGVDATADMAMAKFVFRSLAREHPEPADFLAHANEVVAGEIAAGKFITMAYLALHPSGQLACASAGHPVPRLVRKNGNVQPLPFGRLALGIDSAHTYEQLDAKLAHGAAVVLYTDGVVEARSGGELYGVDRLDACLSERVGLPAQALAAAVLADCRVFAGGELRDDCAVVVARRT